MPEPITIASAAIATSATAYKISCSLHDFIKGAKKVDKTLDMLYTALKGLEKSLQSVEVTLRSGFVQSATKKEQHHGASLQAIDQSLNDCQHTLKALSSVLYGVGSTQGELTVIKRSIYQVKLNMEQSEIASLRVHIQAHSMSLQITLQTLTLAVTCQSSNKIPEDLSTKIDALVDMVSAINIQEVAKVNRELPPEYENDALVGHTTTLLQNAESVILEASTVLSVTSKAGSVSSTVRGGYENYAQSGTDRGIHRDPQDQVRVLNWMSSRNSDKLQATDKDRPLSSANSDMPFRVRTPDTAMSEQLRQTQEELCDSEVEDYEVEAVLILFSRGTSHMVQSKFTEAEIFFQRGIGKAQSMHLSIQTRLEIQEKRLMLALSQLYQGKIDLALPSLKTFCQDISKDNREAGRALKASHALAQLYSCKDDHQLAIDQCRKTIKGNAKFYGKHHPQYKRSMNLLASIYNSSGDTMMGSVYADIASSSKAEAQDQQDEGNLEGLIGFESPPLEDIRASSETHTRNQSSQSTVDQTSKTMMESQTRHMHEIIQAMPSHPDFEDYRLHPD